VTTHEDRIASLESLVERQAAVIAEKERMRRLSV
jgi:hypothetical protein